MYKREAKIGKRRTAMKRNPRFAIILSGCGRSDGSEIHETVTAMLAITDLGGSYDCYAPNIEQAVVINGLTSEKTTERRNVLVESARLARGAIKDISELKLSDYDGVLLPGGLGAVTNWCDFAQSGIECTVDTSINRVLEEAYKQKLVIGAMCIAPVVVARVLGKYGVTVTIGNDKTVAKAIEVTGAHQQDTKVEAACIDEKNRIVTTPAYMLASNISEVNQGARSMVEAMIRLSA